MRRPNAVELSLAMALVLTLAVKTASGFSRRDAVIGAQWDSHVRTALEQSGFQVDGFLRDQDPPLLSVRKAGCRMLIANVSPLGWHRDVLSKIIRPNEQLLFIYQGTVFLEQPVWRTSARYHQDRLLSYAGLAGSDDPVLGVIAARSCGAMELNWFGLGSAK